MLGIPELPADAFTLRQGALYCYFSPTVRDAIPLLARLTNSSKRSYFAIDCSEYELFSGLDAQTQDNFCKTFSSPRHPAFFWHSSAEEVKQRTLNTFLSESQRLHPRNNTLLIFAINANYIAKDTPQQRSDHIAQWASWARQKKLGVLFLFYGDYQSLRPALIKDSVQIAGMLSLQTVSRDKLSIHLHYWYSKVDIIADREYLLDTTANNCLSVIEHQAQQGNANTTTALDEDHIHIAAPALVGADEVASNRATMTHSASDNRRLIESINHLDAATVVFSCSAPNDARDIAVMCYELRTKYGGRPKLIIRELKPCLRYSDTRFLLRSGANLIVPYTVGFSDFLDQIDALQGQVMIRSLPASLSDMLESWNGISQRGYFEPHDFVQHAQLALDTSRQDDLDLVLLLLKPSKTIAIEHCLSLCSMTRNGDLVTVCDGELFILFGACRAADADTALRNSFALPPQEIFAETLQFSEVADIEEAIASILPARDFLSAEKGQQLLSLAPNQPGHSQDAFTVPTEQRASAKPVSLLSQRKS
jgi:cellulose biosynthesis protein BcsE